MSIFPAQIVVGRTISLNFAIFSQNYARKQKHLAVQLYNTDACCASGSGYTSGKLAVIVFMGIHRLARRSDRGSFAFYKV